MYFKRQNAWLVFSSQKSWLQCIRIGASVAVCWLHYILGTHLFNLTFASPASERHLTVRIISMCLPQRKSFAKDWARVKFLITLLCGYDFLLNANYFSVPLYGKGVLRGTENHWRNHSCSTWPLWRASSAKIWEKWKAVLSWRKWSGISWV